MVHLLLASPYACRSCIVSLLFASSRLQAFVLFCKFLHSTGHYRIAYDMLKAEAELEGVMDCLQEVEMGTQQPNTASRTMPLSLLDGGEQPKKDVAPFLVKLLLPWEKMAIISLPTSLLCDVDMAMGWDFCSLLGIGCGAEAEGRGAL
jgi:hypothetical protein